MKIIFAIAAAFSALFVGSIETSPATSGNAASMRAQPVSVETVYVPNRGQVDLSSMVCDDETPGPAVRRVCYNAEAAYVLISVNGYYRQYCGIDRETLAGMLLAPSMDRYYDEIIKGRFICPANETASVGQAG